MSKRYSPDHFHWEAEWLQRSQCCPKLFKTRFCRLFYSQRCPKIAPNFSKQDSADNSILKVVPKLPQIFQNKILPIIFTSKQNGHMGLKIISNFINQDSADYSILKFVPKLPQNFQNKILLIIFTLKQMCRKAGVP